MYCKLPNPPRQIYLWEETGVPGENSTTYSYTLFTLGLSLNHIEMILKIEFLEVKDMGAAPFTVRSTPNCENTNGVEQNTIT